MSKYFIYVLFVLVASFLVWLHFVFLIFDYYWYFQILYLLLFVGGTFALIFLNRIWQHKSPVVFMSFVGAKFFITLFAIYVFRIELRTIEVVLLMSEYMALSFGQTIFFYQLFQKK